MAGGVATALVKAADAIEWSCFGPDPPPAPPALTQTLTQTQTQTLTQAQSPQAAVRDKENKLKNNNKDSNDDKQTHQPHAHAQAQAQAQAQAHTQAQRQAQRDWDQARDRLSPLPGLRPTTRFVAWSARQRRLTLLQGSRAELAVRLEGRGAWDCVTLQRVWELGVLVPAAPAAALAAAARPGHGHGTGHGSGSGSGLTARPDPAATTATATATATTPTAASTAAAPRPSASAALSLSLSLSQGLSQGLSQALRRLALVLREGVLRPWQRLWVWASLWARRQSGALLRAAGRRLWAGGRRAGEGVGVGVGVGRARVAFAPIGLLEMLNAGGAVVELVPAASVREAAFVAAGEGQFGAHCNAAPRAVCVDDEAVAFDFSADQQLLTFELPPPQPAATRKAALALGLGVLADGAGLGLWEDKHSVVFQW